MQFKELESKVHEKTQRMQKLLRDRSEFREAVERLVRREAENLKKSIQAESAKLARRVEAASPKTVAISGFTISGVGGVIGLGNNIYNLSSANLLVYKIAFTSGYALAHFGAFVAILGLQGVVMKKLDLNEKKQKLNSSF